MATIEKRNNSYRITVSAGYDLQGKQIKKRFTWTPDEGMTAKQIEKELKRQAVLFEERCQSGQFIDSSIRFAEFAELWMNDYAIPHLRPSTVAGYKDMLQRINNNIGNIRIDRLQPSHLMQFYKALSENGVRKDSHYIANAELSNLFKKRNLTYRSVSVQCNLAVGTVSSAVKGKSVNGDTARKIADYLGENVDTLFNIAQHKEKLSGKTILHHHRLISSILEKAVKWQIILSNPCMRVEPPKAERREAEYLDEEQTQELINCLQSEPLQYQAIIIVLLYTGMRRGELCGLEWSDIDFRDCLINISKSSLYLPERGIFDDTTKNQSSNRIIKIPSVAVDVLKEHKMKQTTERLKLGDRWIDSKKVFTQWNGKPIHPDTITGWFADFVKRHNLPPIHLHSLRHTNATLLIASGVDLRTVSKRLGHSNMTTTANIYTHAIRSADERAAELLENILNPTAQKRA